MNKVRYTGTSFLILRPLLPANFAMFKKPGCIYYNAHIVISTCVLCLGDSPLCRSKGRPE